MPRFSPQTAVTLAHQARYQLEQRRHRQPDDVRVVAFDPGHPYGRANSAPYPTTGYCDGSINSRSSRTNADASR